MCTRLVDVVVWLVAVLAVVVVVWAAEAAVALVFGCFFLIDILGMARVGGGENADGWNVEVDGGCCV